jgi:hypothetical protein
MEWMLAIGENNGNGIRKHRSQLKGMLFKHEKYGYGEIYRFVRNSLRLLERA